MSYRVINIYYSVMCYTNHINSTRIQSIASMALMVFPDVVGAYKKDDPLQFESQAPGQDEKEPLDLHLPPGSQNRDL